jgi:hypothetical protein
MSLEAGASGALDFVHIDSLYEFGGWSQRSVASTARILRGYYVDSGCGATETWDSGNMAIRRPAIRVHAGVYGFRVLTCVRPMVAGPVMPYDWYLAGDYNPIHAVPDSSCLSARPVRHRVGRFVHYSRPLLVRGAGIQGCRALHRVRLSRNVFRLRGWSSGSVAT